MGMKYLGNQFDIHTGGHDLASVHHNNEIAQSECSTGHAPFVNYWLHNEFVNIGATKMAKSGDNSITMDTLREKGYNPLSLRYLYLQSHYRSQVSFSWDSLSASETALNKLQNTLRKISETGQISESYKTLFNEIINDDLNTAGGLAIVWELLKNNDVSDADKKATILDFDRVLGLKLDESFEEVAQVIPDHIQKLIDERNAARANKDWSTADRIRDEIQALGFTIQDK
jgi:cysteinyl-tRNA synthetase